MARNTDTGKNIAEGKSKQEELNENVFVDETGSFFINPFNDSGQIALSMNDLNYMIAKHTLYQNKKFDKMMKYYRGEHLSIMEQPSKQEGKPDNKIIINYPKQLVKAYVGYFAGVNPSFSVGSEGDRESSEIKSANDDLNSFNTVNNINHFYVQQSKNVDIFGRSLSLVYQDEIGQTRVASVDPRNGFIVYSDDVSATPVFGVRYRKNSKLTGEVIADVYAFANEYIEMNGKIVVDYKNLHAYGVKCNVGYTDEYVAFEPDKIAYGRLPMIEFIADDEKMGLYEDIITVFDAIDSAVSEKKNDVDYFGDAILFVNNMLIDERGLGNLRDLRILMSKNIDGGTSNQGASFLDKPTADGTQENLINRLISSVYDISGVVNLNDKDFTNAASGQALKQRLQGMKQNADTKASLFESSFRELFKCLFTGLRKPEMIGNVKIRFKRNEPLDVLDESQALVNLANVVASGMLSQETALGNMSYIEDAKQEIQRIKTEREAEETTMESVQVENSNENSKKTDE